MTRFRHFQKLTLRAQTAENVYLPLRQDGFPKNPAHDRSKGNFSFFRMNKLNFFISDFLKRNIVLPEVK